MHIFFLSDLQVKANTFSHVLQFYVTTNKNPFMLTGRVLVNPSRRICCCITTFCRFNFDVGATCTELARKNVNVLHNQTLELSFYNKKAKRQQTWPFNITNNSNSTPSSSSYVYPFSEHGGKPLTINISNLLLYWNHGNFKLTGSLP